MTPAAVLAPRPGELVLDLCAAPGGKATELGACLQDEGVLFANDLSNSRAKALLKNLEMQGIGNIYVTSEEPKKLADYFPETFDKVLIDAPCSGEGMFRKDASMAAYWSERGPQYYSETQKELVLQGERLLRPGGYMLYSTCTFSKEEDEDTVSYLLRERPDMELVEIFPYEGFSHGIAKENPKLAKCVRIFPHCMEGEGHFLALLKKRGDSSAFKAGADTQKKEERLPMCALEFLAQIKKNFAMERMYLLKDALYYLPIGLPVRNGIRYLRTGLFLGTVAKSRFEPSQALAMYLKKEEFQQYLDIPSYDIRVIKYLKGETLEVSDIVPLGEKGWILVGTDGHPLGWGKLSGGILKNKYYAGWRWQ